MAAPPVALAAVPLEGRGGLPFADLHGEPLFVHAVRALLDAGLSDVGVTGDPDQLGHATEALARSGLPSSVHGTDTWWSVLDPPVTVVLHDPLCPLVPASFVAECLDAFWAAGGPDGTMGPAVVGYRPVTDTIKTVVEDRIVDTLDRDRFAIVTSPVVLQHDGRPVLTGDFAALTARLRAHGEVRLRTAPSLGRRVDDRSAVDLLACLEELGPRPT